jgi:hypothetical protein
MAKTINVHIETKVPISILTPKISRTKTDSIFYAGKNIAEARVPGLDRTYVLTTAGEYSFTYQSGRKLPGSPVITGNEKSVARWTDKDIDDLEDPELWGWFGINVWQGDVCLDYPVDVYSNYDEAMNAFRIFVEQDIYSYLQDKMKGIPMPQSYRYWVSIPANGTKEFISSRKMAKAETIIAEAIKKGIVDKDDLCDAAGMESKIVHYQ